MTHFSTTLRDLARKCDKSEYDLAELTGLDPSFIHRLMTGEKGPSAATVMRLAVALPMDKNLAAKDPSNVPNVLGVLMSAHLWDATAKSEKSREQRDRQKPKTT